MDLVNALNIYNRNTPGEWSIGEDYDSLQWFGDPSLKPTIEQLEVCESIYVAEMSASAQEPVAILTAEEQLDLIYEQGFDAWVKYRKKLKG